MERLELGCHGFQRLSCSNEPHLKTDVTGAGQDLVFLVGNKPAFEIPLPSIANSNIAGKTEVSLEFIQPDKNPTKSAKNAPDELMELRMYIPGTQQKDDEEGEEISSAQVFHDTIKEKADIGQVTGESIVIFHEVLVSTPRGRYDIHMFPNFLRLHGKTYDYKVPYNTISRMFLLPRADEQNVSLVVSAVCLAICFVLLILGFRLI